MAVEMQNLQIPDSRWRKPFEWKIPNRKAAIEDQSLVDEMQTNTANVLQLGVAFFFIFFAFNSVGSILVFLLDEFKESQVAKHDGYTR